MDSNCAVERNVFKVRRKSKHGFCGPAWKGYVSAMVLLICFPDTPASLGGYLYEYPAFWGAGMTTRYLFYNEHFPFCRHHWRDRPNIQLLQLFNSKTEVVMAEGNVSYGDQVELDRSKHLYTSVTMTGDYICRFPSNLSTSSPPFAITILGEWVNVCRRHVKSNAVLWTTSLWSSWPYIFIPNSSVTNDAETAEDKKQRKTFLTSNAEKPIFMEKKNQKSLRSNQAAAIRLSFWADRKHRAFLTSQPNPYPGIFFSIIFLPRTILCRTQTIPSHTKCKAWVFQEIVTSSEGAFLLLPFFSPQACCLPLSSSFSFLYLLSLFLFLILL